MEDSLNLILDGGSTALRPGDKLSGTVSWQSKTLISGVDLRLFWFTKGKGDQDVQLIERRQLAVAASAGSQLFSFTLPLSPYSFSGKLVSLIWAIEAITDPATISARVEFVMSPSGREIILHRSIAS